MDLRQGIRWLREAVFPTHCVSCSSWGEWWCGDCRSKVELIRRDLCPRCGRVGSEHECALTIDDVDALLATGFYHDPVFRSVVTALKYKGATCLVPSLAQHLAAWKAERVTPWPWAGETSLSIQHVPASPKRVRERGFDQASLVADLVRSELIPWAETSSVLTRRDGGEAQASLVPGPLRSANIHGVFSVSGPAPPVVLLVDDVLTTGSTLNEAARLLRQAGAKRIYGFALAVGA